MTDWRSRARPVDIKLPVKSGGYVDDIGVVPLDTNGLDSAMGNPVQTDWRANAIPVEDVVNSKQDLQAAFESKKATSTPLTQFQAKASSRFTRGLVDPLYGIGQLVPRGAALVAEGLSKATGGAIGQQAADFYNQSAQDIDSIVQQRAQEYAAAKEAENQTGMDIARIAGNIASPVNAVAGPISKAIPATGFIPRIAKDIAIGGLGGSIQPAEDNSRSFKDQKLEQMQNAALLSGAFSAGGNTLSKIVKPEVQDDAKKLLEENIRLTPGQILGGVAKSIEDRLTSLPVVGDAIKGAQARSIQDLNKAVANRSLKPIGEILPDNIPVGRDAVEYVGTRLSQEYEDILPKMKAVYDSDLSSAVNKIGQKARLLPKDQQNALKALVSKNFSQRTSNQIGGEELKEITSELGGEAAGLSADPSHYNRKLGNLIMELKDAVSDSAKKYSDPKFSKRLDNTDKGWANFIRYQKAAGSLGAKDGIITPAQLQNSVKTSEKSLRSGKFAKGKNLMQDLSDPALNVLPSQYPDSGTAGRVLTNLAITGGSAVVSPLLTAGALTGAAAYTRPGIALLNGLITKRPELAEPVSRAIKQGTSIGDILSSLGGA